MIVNKRDPGNWYNSIPTEQRKRQYNPLTDPKFDPDKMKTNEMKVGDGIVARIPKIEGRIFRRKSENPNQMGYVEFLVDRYWDTEKKQARNKKVIIGTDISDMARGLMIINDNYHEYFDRDGNLIKDPLRERKEREAKEKAEEARRTEEDKKRKEAEASKTVSKNEGDERTVDEIRETLLMKEKELDEKLRIAREGLQYVRKQQEQLDAMIEARKIELEDKEKDHLHLLDNILESYVGSIKEQAKRRPNAYMRITEIRTINEILRELKDLFSNSNASGYLHLAEEPREDDLEHFPGTTYSEMDILLTAYRWAISAEENHHLYYET